MTTHLPYEADNEPIPTYRLVLYGVFAAVVLILAFTQMGDRGGGAPATPPRQSATAKCEAAWADNKDNVYNVARTKAEYMANCVGLQNELERIRRDHQ